MPPLLRLNRVFCATSWELEGERDAFYKVIGQFNEEAGMSKNILFVPVSLLNVADKRRFQHVIDENYRDCTYIIFALIDGWGPRERNFRGDYKRAMEWKNDPSLPIRDVLYLEKKSDLDEPRDQTLPEPHLTFETTAEFSAEIRKLLAGWLADLAAEETANGAYPASGGS
jgi:hypothetical protein